MDSLNALIVFFIARIIFNKTTAVISALLYSIYLPLVYYSAEILPPILMTTLVLSSTLFLLKFTQETKENKKLNIPWLILASIGFGFLIITQPTFALAFILIAIWLFVDLNQRPISIRLRCMILFIIISLVPTALVTARNYFLAREPVLISCNGGINFYIGNNADVYKTISVRPGFEWDKLLMRAYVEERITNFAQKSNFWFRKGIEFILQHPLDWLWLMVKKTVLFFNAYEFPRNFDLEFFSKFSFINKLPIIRLNIILPLGLSAIITLLFGFPKASNRRNIILVLLIFFSYSFTIILFFVVGRYRLPIVPFLIIFAAYYLIIVFKEFINKNYFSILKLILLIVTLTVFTQIKFFKTTYPYELPDSFSYVQIGRALIEAGNFNQAYSYLQKGLSLPQDKQTYEIYYYLAKYYKKMGNDEEAIKYYKKAWQLNPEYYDALNSLGFQYKKIGEYDSAIYYLNIAKELAKWHAEIFLNLADCYLLKNDPQKAIEILESFRHQSPSPHPIISEGLGKLYMKFSKWELASKNFEEVFQYPQGYDIPAEIYNLLGINYYRMQQYQKAKKIWTAGLKKDPSYEPIKKNLKYLPH